jgi:plasmid stabilization system protein ParE
MKVRWLLEAYSDLHNIRDYIASNSPLTADKFVIDLYDSISKQLAQFPRLGRVIPELDNPNRREIIYGNYRVMYRIRDNLIEVQSVIHSKREFP